MANYLQRIVAAGARTNSPARPPVGAPPMLPATLLPTPSLGPPTWEQGSTETSRRTAFEPLRETPRDVSVLAEAVSSPVDPTSNIVPPVSTERVPEFTKTSSEASTAPVATPSVPLQVTDKKTSESVELPRPKEPLAASVSPHAPEQVRPAMPAFFRWDAPIRIEAPRGMRPPKAKAETPAHVDTKTNAAIPTADLVGVQHTAEPTRPAVTDSESAPPAQSAKVSSPPVEAKETTAIALPRPVSESPRPMVAAVAAAPIPAATPVPNPASKKQGRISIGSVEVRVNNQPAPAKTAPARPARPVHSDPFGPRYLNRFAIKP